MFGQVDADAEYFTHAMFGQADAEYENPDYLAQFDMSMFDINRKA